MYKNLTVEILSSDNSGNLQFDTLTDLCAEIGERLGNSTFANHERAKLKWILILKWIMLKQFPKPHQKGKIILMIGKQLSLLSQKGKVKVKLMKKYIRNQSLKLQLKLKNKLQREKKFIKSKLEQDKTDMQVSRESDIKKVQDIFDEVKKEEPLNVEIVFTDDNIFNSEKISNVDREFIIDLINRTNFIVDA